MRHRGFWSLIILLGASFAFAQKPSPLSDWFRKQLQVGREEPMEMPETEIILYSGSPADPLKPEPIQIGGGEGKQGEEVYRGHPVLLVLTWGYGSGGGIDFRRPLLFRRPLTDYELVLTFIPPIPQTAPLTTQQQGPLLGGGGQMGGPQGGGMPGGPGFGGFGITGPGGSGPGGFGMGGPGGPGMMRGGGSPGFMPGAGGMGFGGPGIGGWGAPQFRPFIAGGPRSYLRRYLTYRALAQTGQLGQGMWGPGGGLGALGQGGLLGPGGFPGPGLGRGGPGPGEGMEMGPGVSPGGTPQTMGPPPITTLRHLTFLFVTDKGVYTLTFPIPPDETLVLENDWATITVPLFLVRRSPHPPFILYRIGITGDAPEELYIGRLALRPRTEKEVFVTLRAQTGYHYERTPGGQRIVVFTVSANSPLIIKAQIVGPPLPWDIRWDFTPHNGINFDLPDARGREVQFTFERQGVYTCAVRIQDFFGSLPPIEQRFRVEVR